MRFSTGDWQGEARNFGVVNGTDPREVSVATGPVKVGLSYFEHYARDHPDRHGFGPTGVQPGDDVAARNFGSVLGTVVLQLVDDRTLKVETFPGLEPAQVDGFTAAARLYER